MRVVIEEGQGVVAELESAIGAETADGSPLFPLLRGPKLAPLWIRLMAEPGSATIAGLEWLPVAVDVQVRRACLDTGQRWRRRSAMLVGGMREQAESVRRERWPQQ